MCYRRELDLRCMASYSRVSVIILYLVAIASV